MTSEEVETSNTENAGSKRKPRKKLMYQKILQQMEFYFSPANLSKDRWLRKKLEEEEWIHLTEFLRFNKIKTLTEDMNDLAKALRKSEILEVNEEFKVRRTQPITYKENEDDYVIYVEQVPPDADHDWLKGIFSRYGEIDYISIPKFKNSNKCKGFAFVEFSTTEAANNALLDFKEKGNCLPMDVSPEELLSIANFEPNRAKTCETKEESHMDLDISQNADLMTNPRKRKNSELDEECNEEKKTKLESEEESATETHEASATEDTSEIKESKTKKKKHRKKKKNKKKSKDSCDSFGLQILSKRDWKRLRNKYLNMQKEKMKQLKKHLFLAQKKSDSSRHNFHGPQKEKNAPGQCTPSEENVKKLEDVSQRGLFSPGLIVRIKLDEPVVDIKNFKNEMKKNSSVQYVDVKEGESKVFLRFDSAEAATTFCENSSCPKTKILEGQKELNYWDKLQRQRKEKLNGKAAKRLRGKEKLMKKAEHILGKHIIFDEIET